MKEVKALVIDEFEYYIFPEEYDSIEEFTDAVSAGNAGFLRLVRLPAEECEPPYFIAEDCREVFLNSRAIRSIAEEMVYLLPEEEFERMAAECECGCGEEDCGCCDHCGEE